MKKIAFALEGGCYNGEFSYNIILLFNTQQCLVHLVNLLF